MPAYFGARALMSCMLDAAIELGRLHDLHQELGGYLYPASVESYKLAPLLIWPYLILHKILTYFALHVDTGILTRRFSSQS
jgi:hypothetical protein